VGQTKKHGRTVLETKRETHVPKIQFGNGRPVERKRKFLRVRGRPKILGDGHEKHVEQQKLQKRRGKNYYQDANSAPLGLPFAIFD